MKKRKPVTIKTPAGFRFFPGRLSRPRRFNIKKHPLLNNQKGFCPFKAGSLPSPS